MVNGLQGIQASLHEVLAAFRHGPPHGTSAHNGSVGTPDARRISHSPVDSRRPPGIHPSVYPPGTHPTESHQTPSSTSSYENQFSPTVVQPHGPYPSTAQPTASASTQPHPNFHPAFPSLPPISPASANVMPPPRFPTSLPPIRSHISEYQSNVRASQPSAYLFPHPGSARGTHNNSSNVTSADSSDDDGASELPGAGLVAPLEVLRGLGEEHELRAVGYKATSPFDRLLKTCHRLIPRIRFDALVVHLWRQTGPDRRSDGRPLYKGKGANMISLMVSIASLHSDVSLTYVKL
jgi:hypothetical protein